MERRIFKMSVEKLEIEEIEKSRRKIRIRWKIIGRKRRKIREKNWEERKGN